jgi:hypothetical protein
MFSERSFQFLVILLPVLIFQYLCIGLVWSRQARFRRVYLRRVRELPQ